jgi:hypothetical protein
MITRSVFRCRIRASFVKRVTRLFTVLTSGSCRR